MCFLCVCVCKHYRLTQPFPVSRYIVPVFGTILLFICITDLNFNYWLKETTERYFKKNETDTFLLNSFLLPSDVLISEIQGRHTPSCVQPRGVATSSYGLQAKRRCNCVKSRCTLHLQVRPWTTVSLGQRVNKNSCLYNVWTHTSAA